MAPQTRWFTSYHLAPVRIATIKETIQVLAKMRRKRGLVHCWRERRLARPLWGAVWRALQRLKVYLRCDRQSHSWGFVRRKRSRCLKETPAPSAQALFTKTKTWRPPGCPLVSDSTTGRGLFAVWLQKKKETFVRGPTDGPRGVK